MIPSVAIPALVALVFKLVLLGYSATSSGRNLTTRLFFALLVVLAIENALEFTGFNLLDGRVTPTIEHIGFMYVAALIPAVALILHVSLRLSIDSLSESTFRPFELLLYVPTVMLLCLLATGQLVSGFRLFEYTVLRIPGRLYFLFETYLIVYLLAALANLVFGARQSRPSAVQRTRNRLWLIALFPTGLLLLYLIVANHFGWAKLTSTLYLPITLTFFLIVTTYATHQHRLFDIEFFIPWSKTRKRKTQFYRRIDRTMREILKMQSVQDILERVAVVLRCSIALVGGPHPIIALAPGERQDPEVDSPTTFPEAALQKIGHIVVAQEIAAAGSELHRLMKQHRVGAVVPFAGPDASPHWMVFGEHFNRRVYTPLDFHAVEALFLRITNRFHYDQLLERTQLAQIHDDIAALDREIVELDAATAQIERDNALLEDGNRRLREDTAQLHRAHFHVVKPGTPAKPASLHARLIEAEGWFVEAALAHFRGDLRAAARRLGVSTHWLRELMHRHGLGKPGPKQ